MNPELEQLKLYIHQLEIRIVKLEQTVKFGGAILGMIPILIQLWQFFSHKV